MLLHEIIASNEIADRSILIESLLPYKKALLVYYTEQFNCEAALMVTSVTNACQYAKIVPANEFSEAIDEYVDTIPYLSEEDKEGEKESINYNSIMLSNL